MKKWMCFCCFFIFLTGCVTQKISQTSIIPEAKGWRAAYRQVLCEFQKSEEYTEYAAFSLYDISGDGVPELILSPDFCHAACCRIITYQEKAVEVGNVGSYGECSYDPARNLILSSNLGQGVQISNYYRLQNGVLQQQVKFYNDEGHTEDATFRINDVEVSKTEYERMYQFYENGTTKVSLGQDFGFDCIDVVFSGNYISRDEACEILREKLELDTDTYILAEHAQLYQERDCYILRTMNDDYAVDMQTGECFDIQK